MLDYNFFYELVEYGNKNWKGGFSQSEKEEYANDYLSEFNASNEKGKAVHTMEELCKLLIDDIVEGNSKEAMRFLRDICDNSEWKVRVYECVECGKTEIAFFSKEELQNLERHRNREICIQDAIPEKSRWVREVCVSGISLCPDCWERYF